MNFPALISQSKRFIEANDMKRDDPEVMEQVEKAFRAYEKALTSNDVAKLDELFCEDGRTVRFGAGENLYGIDEIRAFRSGRSPVGLDRELRRLVISTFGNDFATTMSLFYRSHSPNLIGRQSQTWVRFGDDWKIVAAHVSAISI
jgi:hypothetical protein